MAPLKTLPCFIELNLEIISGYPMPHLVSRHLPFVVRISQERDFQRADRIIVSSMCLILVVYLSTRRKATQYHKQPSFYRATHPPEKRASPVHRSHRVQKSIFVGR